MSTQRIVPHDGFLVSEFPAPRPLSGTPSYRQCNCANLPFHGAEGGSFVPHRSAAGITKTVSHTPSAQTVGS